MNIQGITLEFDVRQDTDLYASIITLPSQDVPMCIVERLRKLFKIEEIMMKEVQDQAKTHDFEAYIKIIKKELEFSFKSQVDNEQSTLKQQVKQWQEIASTYERQINDIKSAYDQQWDEKLHNVRIITQVEKDRLILNMEHGASKNIESLQEEIRRLGAVEVKFQQEFERQSERNAIEREKIMIEARQEYGCMVTDTAVYEDKIHTLTKMLEESKEESRRIQREFIASMKDEEIRKANAAIQEKNIIIAQLKNTNFCKGLEGEAAVRSFLAHGFTDHEVKDMSSTAAESDIHLFRNDGSFVAIECKNKVEITIGDVTKSSRDITVLKEKYGTSFVGYVFLSLKTPNIPKKGMAFEFIEGIPVIWYGLTEGCCSGEIDNPQARAEVINIVRIAWMLVSFVRSTVGRLDYQDQIMAVTSMLQKLFVMIQSNKACLTKVMDQISSLQHQLQTVQDNNNSVFLLIQDFIKSHDISLNLTGGQQQPTQRPKKINKVGCTELKCIKCGKEGFARKCDLSRHSNTCMES